MRDFYANKFSLSRNASRRYIGGMTPTVFVFERLAALVHQLVREDAARHGLLPVHLQVLGYLAQANRYSDIPIAVAAYLGTTRGTVSQTLSVLERKGLIDRVADDRHGKRIHLTLTLAGEAVLAGSWPRRLEEALVATGVDALNVGDDLRRVLSILQRLNDRQAFGECRQCAHFLREEAQPNLRQPPVAAVEATGDAELRLRDVSSWALAARRGQAPAAGFRRYSAAHAGDRRRAGLARAMGGGRWAASRWPMFAASDIHSGFFDSLASPCLRPPCRVARGRAGARHPA